MFVAIDELAGMLCGQLENLCWKISNGGRKGLAYLRSVPCVCPAYARRMKLAARFTWLEARTGERLSRMAVVITEREINLQDTWFGTSVTSVG